MEVNRMSSEEQVQINSNEFYWFLNNLINLYYKENWDKRAGAIGLGYMEMLRRAGIKNVRVVMTDITDSKRALKVNADTDIKVMYVLTYLTMKVKSGQYKGMIVFVDDIKQLIKPVLIE